MKKSLLFKNKIPLLITCLFFLIIQFTYAQDFNILVFHETNGFRHTGAIEASIEMLEELGSNTDHDTWSVDATQDASVFTTENLANYEVIVFSNTTGGSLLNDDQQAAMEAFIQSGKGFVGFHSATDTYRGTDDDSTWLWYNELVGAIVQSSPNHSSNGTSAIMDKLIDHPVVSHIGDTWSHDEEWYYWELNGGQLSDSNSTLLQVRSTGNESYDEQRPITWLKEFDGGRSFYTALGHNATTYRNNSEFIEMVEKAVLWTSNRLENNIETESDCATLSSDWTDLLENNLECWEVWMGVPHTSTGLPGSSDSVTNGSGTPLGLDNDPANVFSIIEENGEKQLYITGEVYGGLTTVNEYSNYHLSMEFKWGEQKWAPRLTQLRDSGILYHCSGEHGSFWDVWKSSLEFQVQEGDLGDYIGLSGVQGLVPSDNSNLTFSPRGNLNTGTLIRAGSNPELPNGEWNLLEIIVIGDKAIHYVNGVMVNALQDATWDGDTVTKGQIQIQSEGAELYYRNIRIKAEEEFPSEDLTTLGWDGSELPTTICDTDAPIGEIIALKKSGGDEKWVTIDASTNNLIANGEETDRALFLVETHPNGCVALKSTLTDKYIQVAGESGDTIRAQGDAPGTWENFAWEQVGSNQVGLKSEYDGGWIQANWNQDNTSLFPNGAARGTWETFDYILIGDEVVVTPETNTVVHITKRNAPDFAFDGDHGASEDQNVYLYDANENNINQQWIEIDKGDGYYSYQKQGTDFCIDGGDNGTNRQNVFLSNCDQTDYNQQWQKVSVDGGAFQLVKRDTDFALDGGNNGTNEQNIGLWDSSSTSQNLHWFITPIGQSAKYLETIPVLTNKMVIYPNPVVDSFTTIKGVSGSTAYIFDMNGKELSTHSISNENEILDLSNLSSGLYYIQVETGTQLFINKIIKQ